MTAIHIVLFALTSCSLVLCDDADDIKSVKFLKKVLRRNNDDYLETTVGTLNVTNPYLLVSSGSDAKRHREKSNATKPEVVTRSDQFHYRRGPSNTNISNHSYQLKRRNFDGPIVSGEISNLSEDEPTANTSVASTTTSSQTKFTGPKTFEAIQPLTTATPGQRFRSNSEPSEAKSQNVVKLTKFIEKNIALFNEFMQNKRERLKQAPQAPAAVVRAFQVTPSAARAGSSLAPDQLDMAPAKGARIYILRSKGRLCQRHVLLPEGPKYDGRGAQYVPAWRGRHFGRSRAPALLLPRCCNCCKKSVLGCE